MKGVGIGVATPFKTGGIVRSTHRLTAPPARPFPPGYHLDGDGLHLQVSKSGGKSWAYRYTRLSHARNGLRPFPTVSLVAARSRATDSRRLKADGIDPLTQKRHARKVARAAGAKRMTFETAVKKFMNQGPRLVREICCRIRAHVRVARNSDHWPT